MKTICLWCGKDHKKYRPVKCQNLSKLMSAVCKKVPVYQAMRCLEVYGVSGLEALAVELGLHRFVK